MKKAKDIIKKASKLSDVAEGLRLLSSLFDRSWDDGVLYLHVLTYPLYGAIMKDFTPGTIRVLVEKNKEMVVVERLEDRLFFRKVGKGITGITAET